MASISDLVIGTHNRKKGLELADLLAPWGFQVVTLEDIPSAIEVVEDGDSFAANAALKATKPGIYSARFAGPQATDDDNNRHLLRLLGDLPLERRTASYVCHVTVADPTGTVRAESHDTCRGRIRGASAGTNGFGYDPYFEVVEYHRTFGELGPTVKRMLSHRSRALRGILPQLVALM
jgi:XTP/dITP diphosphohydrolase